MYRIPEFLNEANPNPVTAIDFHTQDGTTLRWVLEPPVQQSRMMAAVGMVARMLDAKFELSLPEVCNDPGNPAL